MSLGVYKHEVVEKKSVCLKKFVKLNFLRTVRHNIAFGCNHILPEGFLCKRRSRSREVLTAVTLNVRRFSHFSSTACKVTQNGAEFPTGSMHKTFCRTG